MSAPRPRPIVWPPLPASYESMHGPVPVRTAPAPLRDDAGMECAGYYDPQRREIVVGASPNRLNEWFVYYHECAHVEFLDHSVYLADERDAYDPSGDEERACDAIANGRVRELRASLTTARGTGTKRRGTA